MENSAIRSSGVARVPDVATPEPRAAATDLRAALTEMGLSRTLQTNGEGMSTLSVWTNLTVWCAGEVFFWREDDPARLVTHPTDDPAGAAVKIHKRYLELRGRSDLVRPTDLQ